MTVKPETPKSLEDTSTKSERTRKTILCAAAKQFRIAGYGPSTIRKIAETAGVEAGSIYYHFASKEEIFDAVLDLGLRQIYDAVKEVSDACQKGQAGFRETLGRMIHAHLEVFLRKSDFTSSNIRNFSMLSEPMRERHRPLRLAYAGLWENLLSKAIEDKEIRTDIKVVPLRHFLLGALNWMGEWFNASNYPIHVLSGSVVNLILDGMLDENRQHTSPIIETDFIEADYLIHGDSKAERTRMHILSTAAKVMRASGYKTATIRQIAAEAGMEAGSIYYHFSSKENLLDEILDLGLREMADRVSSILLNSENYADPSQQLAVAINAHMRVLFARSEFTSANIRIYGQLPQEIRARHRPIRRKYAMAWKTCLKNAQDKKFIRRDFDVDPLRLFLIGALNWTVEWFDPDRGGQDGFYSLQEMITLQQTLLLNGIARD